MMDALLSLLHYLFCKMLAKTSFSDTLSAIGKNKTIKKGDSIAITLF